VVAGRAAGEVTCTIKKVAGSWNDRWLLLGHGNAAQQCAEDALFKTKVGSEDRENPDLPILPMLTRYSSVTAGR